MLTMYDDVNLSLVPSGAQAVAGYVNGRWANYPEVVRRWPNAKHLSIAVTANADADCLDVEPGDAANADAAAWLRRQMGRGIYRPVVYTSASNAALLIRNLSQAGIPRWQYRLWSAHYTGKPHRCDASCGFGSFVADATQWTDHAFGESLDETLCGDNFFAAKPKPQPVVNKKDGFEYWAEWVAGGRKWRRPGSAPARIPLSWWKRLPAWLKAHRG